MVVMQTGCRAAPAAKPPEAPENVFWGGGTFLATYSTLGFMQY